MSKKTVKFELDPTNLPPLTEQQEAELATLAKRGDDEVDTDDIPVLRDDFFEGAQVGRFYRPTKISTTIRIDSDVLAWLRSQGRGYQTKINAILRREMIESLNR